MRHTFSTAFMCQRNNGRARPARVEESLCEAWTRPTLSLCTLRFPVGALAESSPRTSVARSEVTEKVVDDERT